MRLKKHSTYKAYATVYDDFKGDRSSNVRLIEEWINKYRPEARTILDLACGTGEITKALSQQYELTGLDRSRAMLKIARRKNPGIVFVKGDMQNFRIDNKFDVVICLHNSINHLLELNQWRQTFETISRHLKKDGLLIFDSNPPSKMDYYISAGPGIKQVGQNYIINQVLDGPKPNQYVWGNKVLTKKGSRFKVHDEPVLVSTYSDQEIIDALGKNYKVAEIFSPTSPQLYDDIDRSYYVCLKS